MNFSPTSPELPYRTGCVIMTSGQSKRFGGNKLLADFRGEPMIMRILSVTEGLFTRRVVVTRHQEIAEICRQRGIDVLLHDLPYRSDTVRLGLEALGEMDGCMFCPADQPLLQKATIHALIAAARKAPESIWRPCYADEPGSPVLFPRWAFAQLTCLPQGKGGGYVIRMHPDRVRTLPVHSPYELMDADDHDTLTLLASIDSDV